MQTRMLFALFFFFFILAPTTARESTSAMPEVVFAGNITPESVDSFILKYEKQDIDKLIIFSLGGDIGAGIKFGEWVRRKNVDVQVRTLCASSCANYIFPAGRRKIIEPGGLVVWHGSMEEKSIRDEISRFKEIEIKYLKNPDSLTIDEQAVYSSKKEHYALTIKLIAKQQRFFSDIKVDEYITRLAQEPIAYASDACTATQATMQKFGITNVIVPEGYATTQYVDNNMLSKILFHEVNIFDVVNGEIVKLSHPQ